MAPHPNMGAENDNFLKFLKTMIVGALWFRLGLLSIFYFKFTTNKKTFFFSKFKIKILEINLIIEIIK